MHFLIFWLILSRRHKLFRSFSKIENYIRNPCLRWYSHYTFIMRYSTRYINFVVSDGRGHTFLFQKLCLDPKMSILSAENTFQWENKGYCCQKMLCNIFFSQKDEMQHTRDALFCFTYVWNSCGDKSHTIHQLSNS